MRSLFPVGHWETCSLPVGNAAREVRDVRAAGGAQR